MTGIFGVAVDLEVVVVVIDDQVNLVLVGVNDVVEVVEVVVVDDEVVVVVGIAPTNSLIRVYEIEKLNKLSNKFNFLPTASNPT